MMVLVAATPDSLDEVMSLLEYNYLSAVDLVNGIYGFEDEINSPSLIDERREVLLECFQQLNRLYLVRPLKRVGGVVNK